MNDISAMLKEVYSADAVVIVPGGGTFGMEAVARQFGRDAKVLVARNGWFSYRWSQIFESNNLPQSVEVMKARREKNSERRKRTDEGASDSGSARGRRHGFEALHAHQSAASRPALCVRGPAVRFLAPLAAASERPEGGSLRAGYLCET